MSIFLEQCFLFLLKLNFALFMKRNQNLLRSKEDKRQVQFTLKRYENFYMCISIQIIFLFVCSSKFSNIFGVIFIQKIHINFDTLFCSNVNGCGLYFSVSKQHLGLNFSVFLTQFFQRF